MAATDVQIPIILDTQPSRLETPKARRRIQSVTRALDILEVFTRAKGELRLNEVASAAKLNISTCHHLLTTLLERGYVGQNPRQRTYYLGSKIIELSSVRVRQMDLVEVAAGELRRLNADTGETVHLDVMLGHDLVTLTKIDSPHAVRVDSTVGKSNAAHATATGKAILAWLPETEIGRIVAQKGLTRFTGNTIVSLPELIEHLRLVRRNGYSLDMEEFQPGVVCAGAAIRDHAGAVMGAISCSLPLMRAEPRHMGLVKDRVRNHARALSERLGNVSPTGVELEEKGRRQAGELNGRPRVRKK